MSTLFRRAPSGVARRPRRGEPKRVPAQHLLQSRSAKIFGNTWVRLACGVCTSLALTSFALGSQHSGGEHHTAHNPPVTIVTQGAGVDAFAVSTTNITPGALPTPTTPGARTTQPSDGLPDATALAADGIPSTALDAYEKAANAEKGAVPSCGLSWPLLAAIGRVESDHGRFAGALLHVDGVSTPKIIGIALNGHGTALIRDTDKGLLDGDKVYDRAVGPMQFIPTTWGQYGMDGNGDHVADPFNLYDAARTAATYLCTAGGDLTTLAGQTRAIRAYNDSDDYLKLVLATEAIYARGVAGIVVPALPASGLPPTKKSPVPPADPGPPLGLGHGQTSGVGATSTSAAPHPSTSSAPTSSTSATGSPTPSSTSPSPPPVSSSSAPPPSSSAPPTSTDTSSPPPSSSTSPSTSPSDASTTPPGNHGA